MTKGMSLEVHFTTIKEIVMDSENLDVKYEEEDI